MSDARKIAERVLHEISVAEDWGVCPTPVSLSDAETLALAVLDAPRWVSAEERLPEGRWSGVVRYCGMFRGSEWSYLMWAFYRDRKFCAIPQAGEISNVTHWLDGLKGPEEE